MDDGQPSVEDVHRRRRHPLSMKKRLLIALPIAPIIGAAVLTLFLCLISRKSPNWILKRLAQVYGLAEAPPDVDGNKSQEEPAASKPGSQGL